ncbi:Cof-type HAD-IIB family hydrolase [Arsenicicoccus piscis]|uniref:Haloacid dehalogenase n=1 Tax=Arsenicicoccus piscis TaxID=673954 RepID=A0ABQ6HUI5_9MICO|nr:Cof-type HAD-IIB family hydrolase [Arsenicicoccus piscis]MCH8626577.1 Cof-type HAD-IIB family hydrolase [Arsenicicoccus piscis]GMA21225.1 haloacid dehalogenase [Arsenicicoccus piscis]
MSQPLARPSMICLDIDGTTINHAGVLSPAVRDAVQDVVAAGHHVVMATGRASVATMPIIAELGITTGRAVCSNGATTIRLDPNRRRGYKFTQVVTFDPGPSLRLLREKMPTSLFAVEELGRGYRVSAPFPEGELTGEIRVVPWEELLELPATRVTIRDPETPPADFLRRVQDVGLHGVTYAVGYSSWLDINPEGVSKASALELVRRKLGVDPADTVACGDQRNDIEMLRWAAHGVAMGNAPDEVKAVADHVTGTVDEDGLATVLRRVLAAGTEKSA